MSEDAAFPESASFGYRCTRCGRCCIDKAIQINPYEAARLARRLGETGAEFRERHSEGGTGVRLARTTTGACIFLGPEGCTVHSDRPLVCRVYPLARHIHEDGRIWFTHLGLEPPPGGDYTVTGRVSDYLEQQGAAPFIAANDSYFLWYCKASAALAAAGVEEGAATGAADLWDLDAAVAVHCATHGLEEPEALEERLRLHLEILDGALAEWLAATE